MAPIAFTLCSNNYFSRALAWADSMRAINPEYTTVIGLVDSRNTQVDYESHGHTVIAVEEIMIPNFHWMISNYNIIEFNTAVKPYYFEFLFKKYTPPHVLYFDPDIMMYSPVSAITSLFSRGDMLLTPHVNHPIPKDSYPWENHFLRYGIYNLGFAGLKEGGKTPEIINWWKERLAEHCVANTSEGLYVDQLWANYFPLFFDGVVIVRHSGANVAYWNLQERELTKRGEAVHANSDPLVFFHFSSFDPNRPTALAKDSYTNYDVSRNSIVLELARHYAETVKKNQYDIYSKIPFGISTDTSVMPEQAREIAARIRKKEIILNSLTLRLVKKETIINYVVSLLKDYSDYNAFKKGIKSENIYSIEEMRKQNADLHTDRKGGILAKMKAMVSGLIIFK